MLLALIATSFGCSDLKEVIYDESLDTELIQDPANAPGLVAPTYAQLRHLNEFFSFWGLVQAPTDETMFPTRGTDWYDNGAWQELHLHTWTASHGTILNGWNALVTGISRANTGLYYLNQFEQSTEITDYINELRFLRAYYMYECLNLFGKVPFRESDETDYSVPAQVLTSTEAAEWLVDELTAIIPAMKLKSDIPYGRVSKGTAQTLLAKIYLNYEVYTGSTKWSEALAQCDAVINSNEYEIATDYWGMFQYPASTENEGIFIIIHNDNFDEGGGGVWVNFTLHYSQGFGNYTSLWNGACTTESFLSSWDTDDVRYQDNRNISSLGFNQGFLVGQQYNVDGEALKDRQGNPLVFTPEVNLSNAAETQGVRVVKYAPNPETTRQFNEGNDFLAFRISDVYLMRAEAKLRSGDANSALTDINAIRSKRGVDNLTSVNLEQLLAERGFELYWEGHRRMDLIRFGKFTEAYSEKPRTDATKTLYPIPQSAMDVNPNLTQNPGY